VPPKSPMAAKDREVFALLETTAPPEARAELLAGLETMMAAPGAVERAHEAYALLDDLADAGLDDPRVDEAARLLADLIPAELIPADVDLGLGTGTGTGTGTGGQDARGGGNSAFLRAFFADFAPAQAEAIRRTFRILTEDRR
jgi:hypothetical protein